MNAAVLGFIGGLAAGAAIGAVSRSVETSRIAFGPYALYGNGALAIPVLLAPIAIFAGWAWLIRRPAAPALGMLLFTAGLLIGHGAGYGIAMGDPLSMFGGILGIGLFVVPSAALAGLTVAFLRARGLTSTAALITAFLGGALLAALPPLSFLGGLGASGISAGAGVVASERSSAGAAVGIGVALMLLGLVQVFALPLLVPPR